MASTVTSTNNLSLRSILEKDKLTGSNFLDWERNLMIVLRHERKWYVLEEPLGEAPPANAPAAARNAHKKHSDDLLDVVCLMLATMSPDLQAGLINTNAYDMIRQLRDMFQTQARTERYDATKAFNECKMVRGTSVSDHVMKMKRHLDHLERLGHPVPLQLATDTILNSLSEDYRPFVVNYNMNNMEKTIAELHSMLKTAELNMGNKNKTKDVLMVKDGGVKKKNRQASTSKGKGPVQAIQSAPKKGKGKGKGKKVKPNKARTENRCFICMRSVIGVKTALSVMKQEVRSEMPRGSYDQLLNNSYKCCRLKVAQIFDRVANIGRDPRLRLLLGVKSKYKSCLESGQQDNPRSAPNPSTVDDQILFSVGLVRHLSFCNRFSGVFLVGARPSVQLSYNTSDFQFLKFRTSLSASVNLRSFSSSTKMSRDLLSMGSKSKPPVLQIGEYPQWRVRMIQFLNNIDKTLMVSIQEGPIKPYIDIPGTPETATTPAIEPRRVFKLFRHYNELEKIRAELDDKALTLLTMAIPNDLFNRVDSRNTAKELWDELEKQFQGTERYIQAKLNQAIGAYEGFKALEGETLADSYSRFNIILNDLRRNGMQKSTSEINFKFLKNLNPEWDHYSVNLQMNKNLAEEDLHDLYSILSQHELKVKDIVMKQKSISDSLALLTEKKKSVLPSASQHEVKVKDIMGRRSSIRNPSSITTKETSTSQRIMREGRRGRVMRKKRQMRKEIAPKVRDFGYYSKKAQLAKRKSEGKVLMAEEECWYDDTSDDEDSAHFTQVHYNLMASVEETINLHKETEASNEVSQTPSDSDMSDNDECSLEEQFLILKAEFDDLKEKIKFERARVIEFNNECELYKSLADDRELEKAEIRKEKAKLESQISEMKSALVNLESEKAEYMIKYEVCFQDRSEAYAKIKQLEDLNIKRGQTQQTLKLLTNNLKDTRFYNPKMGLGLPENDVLKKAPKGLYQFDNLSFPKLNETFVKSGSSLSDSSDKGKEKVVDDSSDSLSDSKPKRKNNFDFTCDFKYDDLNQSYKTRKPEFSHTQCVSLYSQDVKSFSNESEKLSNNIENESTTTKSTTKSEDKTSELEKETDYENLSEVIQVNNLSENKSVSDYESDSDSDETKPCFDSDNDDDIEKGFAEEKINFISNPMFESQETPPCIDQSIKPEVTELITYVVIDKDGYLVYKSLDSMVEGDILKSELKLPDVEFGAVFEKPKSGIQDKPNVVNVSSDSGISKDYKSSCTLSKSETCSINFDASTFEVGSTSCATLETSSKDSSDVCSVPKTPINSSSSDSTDLKSFKRHGLGWKKKDSKKKKRFVKKSSVDDANKCNLNVRFNKCQNSFESALMFFAMQRLHCTHCGDNSFSLNSSHVNKKRSSGVSYDKSNAYSFDHRAKVFSAKKKKNLSKAKDKSVDVKFVCKWIPKDLLNAQISKSGINCKILGSSSDLLKMYETNKKGPIWIWVPKIN
ncbi:hypothetical protein OSB04_028957 [Centaurea solstitialis]|uniref:Uncharacterized protein n=1 Tax=Centaurea solstitialis TaxID=347529 RepID=A0AA38WBQ0_9ASTR|nr:hypothetical protein OSB04_028957 [Centaurea solstitialis]